MKLVSDPITVKKLSSEQEDENWGFRSFLKQIDMETEELDAIAHRHYHEVSNQIDCRECGNCCRAMHPVIDDSDVERLSIGLKLPEDEVTDHFLTTDDEGDLTFNKKPCPLLSGTQCSVYEHRPDDCRSFPHLHKPEFASRLIQVIHNCSICPIVYNVFERLKDELWDDRDDFDYY